MSYKFKSQGRTLLHIIQVYAPANDHADEKVKKLYKELKKAIDKKSCRHHIKTGGFTAKN